MRYDPDISAAIAATADEPAEGGPGRPASLTGALGRH